MYQISLNQRFQILNELFQSKNSFVSQLRFLEKKIDVWLSVIRDVILIKYISPNLVKNSFVVSDLQQIADKTDIIKLIEDARQLKQLKVNLYLNINPRLSFENYFIKNLSQIKKVLICLVLIVLTLNLAGCTVGVKQDEQIPPAGIFKSFDAGTTWVKKNVFLGNINNTMGKGNIDTISVKDIIFDPQDNQALYLITQGDGFFYSYDGGESWMQPKKFSKGIIQGLAIDPNNKCTIYIAFSNQIYKSIDCNRSFDPVYTDSRPNRKVTALAVDAFNLGIIYAGTDEGEILKSFDSGLSWTTIKRIDNKIEKILIDFNDTRIIYVATQKKGLFKTINSGDSWKNLDEGLKKFSAYREYRDLIFIPSKTDALILLTSYGILRTNDGGETWRAISLITPPLQADIRAVAVSPKNAKIIYYGTPTTFYKTVDGGQNWITNKLPNRSSSSYLVIDPKNANILYLGLNRIKE